MTGARITPLNIRIKQWIQCHGPYCKIAIVEKVDETQPYPSDQEILNFVDTDGRMDAVDCHFGGRITARTDGSRHVIVNID